MDRRSVKASATAKIKGWGTIGNFLMALGAMVVTRFRRCPAFLAVL